MRIATLLLPLALLCASPALASDGRVGVGIETSLSTTNAPAGAIMVVYDARAWRLDGLMGLSVIGEALNLAAGARFHYVVHTAERADFSLGAGAFVLHGSRGNGVFAQNGTRGELDAFAQLRVFLAENVCAQAALGMGVSFGDGGVALALAGQLSGSLGLAYYF